MLPSSKVTTGGLVGLLVAGILYAAGAAGVEVVSIEPSEFPAMIIALLVSYVAAWAKREGRPSDSARETIAAE